MDNTHFIDTVITNKVHEAPKALKNLYGTTEKLQEAFLRYIREEGTDLDVMSVIAPICKQLKEELNPIAPLFVEIARQNEVGSLRHLTATAAAFHFDEGVRYFDQLTPAERVETAKPWVMPMVRLAGQGDGFAPIALGALLRATPRTDRVRLFDIIEECRLRQEGKIPGSARASLVYAQVQGLFRDADFNAHLVDNHPEIASQFFAD